MTIADVAIASPEYLPHPINRAQLAPEISFNPSPVVPDTAQLANGESAGFRAKIRALRLASHEDLEAAAHPGKLQALRLGWLAFELAGYAKTSRWMTYAGSLEVTSATNSPALGIATGFAIGTAYGLVAAVPVDNLVTHHPRTLAALVRNYPKTSKLLIDTVPGMAPDDPSAEQKPRQGLLQRLGTHIRRAPLAGANHNLMIVTAGMAGKPRDERRRFRRTVIFESQSYHTAYTAAIIGSLAVLEQFNPEQADRASHDLKNFFVNVGLGYSISAFQLSKTFIKQRRAAKQQPPRL